MQQFRITKYDPGRRDANGVFLDDDWTCASEIGKEISGKILDYESYFAVEAAYVDAALKFFDCSGLDHLRITGLENEYDSETLTELRKCQPELHDPVFPACEFQEDQCVGAEQIALRLKMNLRNVGWCALEVDQKFFIHTGWDYYMYVGCAAPCEEVIPDICASGLFVESFSSPYGRPKDFNLPVQLTAFPKRETDGQEPLETALENVTIPQLRDVLGYSDEHPLFGYFELDRSNSAALQDVLGLSLEFDRYNYTLSTKG